MKQTLIVKLDTTPEQFASLSQTMERFNEVCNFIAEVAHENHLANKIKLQPLVYREARKRFGLSAQMAVRAIAKVVEAYKRDRSRKPSFRPHGAMVYDQRILSWKGIDRVSILTLNGRIRIPIRIGEYQKARMDRVRGQADLILRNKTFYLAVIVDAPEPTEYDPVGVLGVDLGIVNLAVDSDGCTYKGEQVDTIMNRTESLRARLRRCGSKSAKRHLEKISGREKRFRRNINHNVSKKLVEKAKDTERTIALEDLRGIRQTTVRKAQRRRHTSWAFRQLRNFIEYKARLNGVPVMSVNPRDTSHICPNCGCNERKNRPSRNEFRCVQCGFADSADHIAAINIAARAAVNQPIVACNEIVEHGYKLLTSVTG